MGLSYGQILGLVDYFYELYPRITSERILRETAEAFWDNRSQIRNKYDRMSFITAVVNRYKKK